jgi:hypothetical protein
MMFRFPPSHHFTSSLCARIFLPVLIVALFAWLTPFQVHAGEETAIPDDGQPLCLPDRFKVASSNCLRLGPVAFFDRMAKLGITFPRHPFPGHAPDPSLVFVDIRYGQVVTPLAPVYGSLEEAQQRRGDGVVRRIDSPYSFISYTDEALIDGRRFYMVDYGGWMTANDVSRIGAPSRFQGLQFSQTPERSFGWILYPIETKRTPGLQKPDFTGHTLYRYEVVQVYTVEKIGGVNWYMIGPDEWIPEKLDYQRYLGRVLPNTVPPEGVTNGRWIEINLDDQTIAVYSERRLVYASLVASGIEPFWTRPGLFQIYLKLPATPMVGSFEADRSDAYYLEDVPWTMYYDKARALHGAYWHNSFGSVRSHGCVNLSVGDARWLYDWAQEGDWVYVWDPSGKTPTDPALYGDGGA